MTDGSAEGSFARREVLALVLRLMGALVAVSVFVALLGYFLRPTAEAIGRGFVRSFGIPGMALGTFLADGLHFPVPPQFYMLLAVASGTPPHQPFAAIAGASVAAGFFGYAVAGQASRLAWFAKKTQQARDLLAKTYERYGYRAALVASLLPIPYSVLCYLSGLNRMPRTFLALLALCRVPKLVAFYYLVHVGWSFS
jgi:membrane protein YqaA with SNARE-associated domain